MRNEAAIHGGFERLGIYFPQGLKHGLRVIIRRLALGVGTRSSLLGKQFEGVQRVKTLTKMAFARAQKCTIGGQ
jgi:hypothetical protein